MYNLLCIHVLFFKHVLMDIGGGLAIGDVERIAELVTNGLELAKVRIDYV